MTEEQYKSILAKEKYLIQWLGSMATLSAQYMDLNAAHDAVAEVTQYLCIPSKTVGIRLIVVTVQVYIRSGKVEFLSARNARLPEDLDHYFEYPDTAHSIINQMKAFIAGSDPKLGRKG